MFVEPSWINLLSLEKMAKALGADKLMFSSDMPQNTPAELAIFRAVFTSREDLAKVLAGTALRVLTSRWPRKARREAEGGGKDGPVKRRGASNRGAVCG